MREAVAMEKVSIKQAKERGLKFYFTGIPCLRGNVAKRYLNGACTCKDCQSARVSARRRVLKKDSCTVSGDERSILIMLNQIFR